MIAALNKGRIVAPMTFEGYCDTEVFNGWFEQFLAPILQPGQTVILDNATFHKSNKIFELAKSVGADILYLPPYSPDFNKIEHHWFAIKKQSQEKHPSIHIFSSCCRFCFSSFVATIMRRAIIINAYIGFSIICDLSSKRLNLLT